MPNEFHNNGEQTKESAFDWQKLVAHLIVDKEYTTFKTNSEKEIKDLNAILDMLVCDRAEKDYDWQSDIFIPDLPSITWTQIGELVVQYFSRHEKVDCPVDTNDPVDIMKAKAAKTFINYHLNANYLHYLQKFIRLMILNRLGGWAVAKVYYESDVQIEERQVGVRQVPRETGVDIYGGPYTEDSPYPERIALDEVPEMEQIKHIFVDRPNFDVWPNHDVFMDNRYCYSLQDKDPVIFRSEVRLSDLQRQAQMCQYFNLEVLENEIESETSRQTYNKQDSASDRYQQIVQKYDPLIEILERWGTWPVIQGENGAFESGIDENGKNKEGSQLRKTIITIANLSKKKIPIRFQLNYPEFGGYGFLPAFRMRCYIHPIKDRGIGDGTYGRELQRAINDTFNMNNDRVQLATFPTIKKRKYALVDNDTLSFGPENVWELENMDDVDIVQIEADIQAGLVQQDMLWSKYQQVAATYTHDMGGTPTRKEPVTTMMLAEQKGNIRNSLVNLTVEKTGLSELYAIMLKMSGLFMQPETLVKILGNETPFFDPEIDYNFTPVSTAILTEHAKETKIQIYDQLLGRIVNIPNPATFALVNLFLKEIFELAGKEYAQYGNALLDPNALNPNYLAPLLQATTPPRQPMEKEQKGKGQNQYGNRQSSLEQAGRQAGTLAGGGRI